MSSVLSELIWFQIGKDLRAHRGYEGTWLSGQWVKRKLEHILGAKGCQSSVVSAATGVCEVQHEPNAAPCLFVKFHWNTASPIHLYSSSVVAFTLQLES